MRDLVRREEFCDDVLGCPDAERPGEHLSDCPRLILDQEIANTEAGRAIQRALLFRRAIHTAKVHFTSDRLPYETLMILGILEEEESKYSEEKRKRQERT